MVYFRYDDELDRLTFGDDWVDIKKKMSNADQNKLYSHFMRVQALRLDANPEIDVDMELGASVLLEINIKAWSFKDRSGDVAPINRETIGLLDSEIATEIAQAINDRNPPPKAKKGTSGKRRSGSS